MKSKTSIQSQVNHMDVRMNKFQEWWAIERLNVETRANCYWKRIFSTFQYVLYISSLLDVNLISGMNWRFLNMRTERESSEMKSTRKK